MKLNIKKLAVSSMLTAIAVSLSSLSIPIGASKCFPIQHLVNVISGIFLGPVYGVCIAFSTSLLRNLMGTGSLLAFPGSMVGALCCGLIYQKFGKLTLTYLGEIVGTGIIGGLFCYPVATFLMGQETALFAYVVPFLMSTLSGTLIAVVLIGALYESRALDYLKKNLEVHS